MRQSPSAPHARPQARAAMSEPTHAVQPPLPPGGPTSVRVPVVQTVQLPKEPIYLPVDPSIH